MILVRDIRLPLSAGEPQAFEKALHLARISRSKAAHLGVARLSVDARHGQPKLVYTIAVTLKDEGEESAYAGASPCVAIRGKTDLSVQNGTQRLPHRPVVCGLGPAGLFAALLLARNGYRPLVLERGPALDERIRAVGHFEKTGELNPNANIQFGEGGAGTFSDGKLSLCYEVGGELPTLIQHNDGGVCSLAAAVWRDGPHRDPGSSYKNQCVALCKLRSGPIGQADAVRTAAGHAAGAGCRQLLRQRQSPRRERNVRAGHRSVPLRNSVVNAGSYSLLRSYCAAKKSPTTMSAVLVMPAARVLSASVPTVQCTIFCSGHVAL